MTTAAPRAEAAPLDLEALVRAHIDAENAHDLDAVMATIADDDIDYRVTASGEAHRTREDVRDFYRRFVEAVPDMHLDIENMIVDRERRQVSVEYLLSGTHRGWFWGLAPTGRPVSWRGVVQYAFDEDGKLTREVSYFDKDEILESLGIMLDTKNDIGRLFLILPQSPIYTLRCVAGALVGEVKKRFFRRSPP